MTLRVRFETWIMLGGDGLRRLGEASLGLEPERDFPRLPLEREEELERPRDLGVPRTPFVLDLLVSFLSSSGDLTFPLSLRPLLLLLLLLLPLALELLLELLEELDELEPLLLLDLDADLDRERTAIVPCLRPKV